MIPAKEIKHALETAWKIPGLYGKREAAFLYRLARRKGNLVELGCWMGRTTAIMLQAAAIWNASLTTVDAFTPMPNNRKQATPDRWRSQLKRAGLKPPTLIQATTDDDAAQVFPQGETISLLFIDAAHGLEAVRRDLANWTPRIVPGGVVALHDMFYPSITGVCQAVVDWWIAERDGFAPRWRCVGMHEYTIAFMRLP